MAWDRIVQKKHTTKDGYNIEIYDDIFSLQFKLNAYDFVKKSLFRLGWDDSTVPERKSHDLHLHSEYSREDLERLGIIRELEGSPLLDSLAGYEIKRTVVNLTLPCSTFYIHHHPQSKILLYYVNIEWKDGWHGETMFYSDSLKEVEYCSPFTPGRIILFDGKCPHALRPQSFTAPQLRFTLAVIFDF